MGFFTLFGFDNKIAICRWSAVIVDRPFGIYWLITYPANPVIPLADCV
jgi:hypothetical protein